jgi:hypothetical protein
MFPMRWFFAGDENSELAYVILAEKLHFRVFLMNAALQFINTMGKSKALMENQSQNPTVSS